MKSGVAGDSRGPTAVNPTKLTDIRAGILPPKLEIPADNSLNDLYARVSRMSTRDSGVELSPIRSASTTDNLKVVGSSFSSATGSLPHLKSLPNSQPLTPLGGVSVAHSHIGSYSAPRSVPAHLPNLYSPFQFSEPALAHTWSPTLQNMPPMHHQPPPPPLPTRPSPPIPLSVDALFHPSSQQQRPSAVAPNNMSLGHLTHIITQLLQNEPKLVPLLQNLIQQGTLENALLSFPLPQLTMNGFDTQHAQALFNNLLLGTQQQQQQQQQQQHYPQQQHIQQRLIQNSYNRSSKRCEIDINEKDNNNLKIMRDSPMTNVETDNAQLSKTIAEPDRTPEIRDSVSTWSSGSSGRMGNATENEHSNADQRSPTVRSHPKQSTGSDEDYTTSPDLELLPQAIFACKLFVGGVPWDITDEALRLAFSRYGPCRVEWPGKDVRTNRSPGKPLPPRGKATGYVYIVYEYEYSVRGVLQDCSQDFGFAGDWYFKLTAQRARTREIRQVQIIPWVIDDSTYIRDEDADLRNECTVFVGALHGMVTAEILACVMSDLFGEVLYAGIDTDRHKYPIGSGRVTFANRESYIKSIRAAYVEIKTAKFNKRIQIDPFLEDTCCNICERSPGPYFCRDERCFKYYCRGCWQTHHSKSAMLHAHKPLMRNARRLYLPSEQSNPSATEQHSGANSPVSMHSGWSAFAGHTDMTDDMNVVVAGEQQQQKTVVVRQ